MPPPPLDLPEEVDLKTMGKLLKSIEMAIHRDGWHGRAPHSQVFAIFESQVFPPVPEPDDHDVTKVRMGKYTALRILGPHFFRELPVQPWVALRRMAITIAYGTENPQLDPMIERLREIVRAGPLIGFASCQESWLRKLTREQLLAEASENWEHKPDRVEARTVVCIDAWDRVHLVERERGAKPDLGIDVDVRGDVSTSLRILIDYAFGRTPPQDQFDERYPTLAEYTENRTSMSPDMPPEPDWAEDDTVPPDAVQAREPRS